MRNYMLIYKLGDKWNMLQKGSYPLCVTKKKEALTSGTYKPHHHLSIVPFTDLNNFLWNG